MALSESENNLKYAEASADVANIGDFAEGSVTDFSKNNIDGLNDTLTFIVTNPTGAVQNVNLFGFTNGLFLPPAAVNPPPSILLLPQPAGLNPGEGVFCSVNNSTYIVNQTSNDLTCVPTNVGLPIVSVPLLAPTFNVVAPSNASTVVGVFNIKKLVADVSKRVPVWNMLPPIPAPPATINAPEVAFVLSVVTVNCKLPALIGS
jgi:hypothetical protein